MTPVVSKRSDGVLIHHDKVYNKRAALQVIAAKFAIRGTRDLKNIDLTGRRVAASLSLKARLRTAATGNEQGDFPTKTKPFSGP